MRVCLVTRELESVTPYTGGLGVRYAALASEFARLGHETHVVVCADGRRPTDERLADVAVHVLGRAGPAVLWPLEDAAAACAVDRALRRLGRFDAVLAPEYGGDAAAYARRASRSALVTNLTTSLDQILALSEGAPVWARLRVKHFLQRRLERGQTRRSDALIACSHAVLRWASELWELDAHRAVVLPNTVDVQRVRRLAEGPPPPGLPQGAPIVAFCGRLESRKGPDILVESMQAVWDARPEVELVLLGGDAGWGAGTMADRLRTLAGVRAPRVHILGAQPAERLFPALARADIVALPSRWEAFGLVALEAMALARPVIVTDGGGFPDFVRDGRDGVVVAPEDRDALGAALIALLGDPALRETLGRSASERADEFTPALVVPRYAAVLAEVAR